MRRGRRGRTRKSRRGRGSGSWRRRRSKELVEEGEGEGMSAFVCIWFRTIEKDSRIRRWVGVGKWQVWDCGCGRRVGVLLTRTFKTTDGTIASPMALQLLCS